MWAAAPRMTSNTESRSSRSSSRASGATAGADFDLPLALPALLASAPYANYQQGLLKLEVDTTAGSIRTLGLAGVATEPAGPLWQERSLQMGDQLYYLSKGELGTFNW